MTTYDQIWQCFIDNCGVDVTQLPTDDYRKYNMIKNATMHYNNFIDEEDNIGKITCDDSTETINVKLDGSRLLILAYCMKYVELENQLVEFEELYTPFQKEMGIKNYKDQVKGRENTLARTNQKIIELLSNIEDRSIM